MQTWEQTYQIGTGGVVSIEQESGAVSIRGWDRPEVHVRATTSGDDAIADRLRAQQDGHALRLEVRRPRGIFLGFLGGDQGARLGVCVPRGTHCQIDTGSGPVKARQIHGSVAVEAGSGGVELEQIGGRAVVEVGSGSVVARRIAGDLQIETGSGSLTVADVEGRIELETGSGSVSVDRVRGGLLRMETGGGTVRLSQIDVRELELESGSGSVLVELARVHPGGSYGIETGSGGVTLALPRDASLDVSLQAHSGRIRYDGVGLRVTRSDQGEIEGTIGTGGADLSIETGSGGITLKPYEGPAIQSAPPRDAALENSEQLQRVLQMVEQGKLTAEEAEALLRALDEEETPA